MANESKTKWVTFDTTLFYAQVFEGNRDKGSMHEETDGVTKVTLLLNDEQVDKLKEMGVPATALGYDTFKKTAFSGDDWAYVAKRPWVSKYLKTEDGSKQFMGAPLVFDYHAATERWKATGSTGRLSDEHIVPWTMQDGLIGNGTKAKVKLSVYVGTNKAGKPTSVVTLESVAITDLVVYEGTPQSDDLWF
jgi:hypothetical protein